MGLPLFELTAKYGPHIILTNYRVVVLHPVRLVPAQLAHIHLLLILLLILLLRRLILLLLLRCPQKARRTQPALLTGKKKISNVSALV